MIRKLTFMLVMLSCITIHAQFKDYSYKIGLTGNYLLPGNEFTEEKYNPSLLFRGHFGFQLSSLFDLGFGLGYGWNQGEDYGGNKYKTAFIPGDVRLGLSPFNSESVNPYIYVGAGIAYYKLDPKPLVATVPPGDESNIIGLVEGGLGFEFALSKSWVLDLTGGINFFSNDEFNGDMSNLQDKFFHDYDRYINIGLGISYVATGCDTDEDNDGLTECEENKLGSDPNNPDTDGDGLMDGQEVNNIKSSFMKADTDGDGLKDGEEVNKYKTDPNKADTDGDGLKDGEEVNSYKTDPLVVDTDKDGLNDGDEVNKYKTDPLNPDTDKDGLKDGEEVNKYKTNPLDPDTDKGTVKDGEEVTRGSNPLDAKDDVVVLEQPKEEKPLILEGIMFETNSAKISPKSNVEILDEAAETLKKTDRNVEIAGHTDNVGKHEYNMKLSLRRANAVKDYLVKKGISAGRITTNGYGPDKPIASNDTPEGRHKNRRIEFILK